VAGTGGSGAGSDGGRGGSSGAGGGGAGAASKLPVPPGAANVPRPSGGAANLKVIAWAGFKGAISYTFDDSQPSQIDHWPEIRATGVPVTYYVTTVNNYYANYDATWKEVVAKGGELGNHTVHHCYFNLSGCMNPLATAAAEIDQCTDYIKTKLGVSGVYTIAYPFGDGGYKESARDRFLLARGTSDGMVAPGDNTDPFDLPTKAAGGGENASVFSGIVDTARTQGKWANFLFHSLLPNAQNWYAGVDIKSVTDSIGHAKSLGDVWIGTMADIGAYWLGQKAVQAAFAAAPAATTWSWTLPAHFPPGKFVRVTIDGGTLTQGATLLTWDPHGYYEIALDGGPVTWKP
ncbi:MAG TPA: polysaccharide deacetylase family protein, partial [Polyangiaceae bacterium]|nr:polysaccharide deacetylase family protein [Polyangiaceae bacterium]